MKMARWTIGVVHMSMPVAAVFIVAIASVSGIITRALIGIDALMQSPVKMSVRFIVRPVGAVASNVWPVGPVTMAGKPSVTVEMFVAVMTTEMMPLVAASETSVMTKMTPAPISHRNNLFCPGILNQVQGVRSLHPCGGGWLRKRTGACAQNKRNSQ